MMTRQYFEYRFKGDPTPRKFLLLYKEYEEFLSLRGQGKTVAEVFDRLTGYAPDQCTDIFIVLHTMDTPTACDLDYSDVELSPAFSQTLAP